MDIGKEVKSYGYIYGVNLPKYIGANYISSMEYEKNK